MSSVLEAIASKRLEALNRLRPENIKEFIRYYFDIQLGKCHEEWFQKYLFNPVCKKLLLEAPMGHGKSTLGGIFYPIHLICENPRVRILLAGATLERATDLMRAITYHLENNELLIRDFGPFKAPNPEKWTQSALYIARAPSSDHPTLRTTAVNSSTAGKRADHLLFDDLVTLENSTTPQQRAKIKHWFKSIYLTRLEPGGIARGIGTEYGSDTLYQDIITHKLGEFDDWTSAIYRAIDENNPGPNGELWVEKWPLEELLKRKKEIGTIAFEMCYQNNPKALEGAVFKPGWLQFHSGQHHALPLDLKIYSGCDLAISDEQSADFFVCVTIGMDALQNIFILDIYRSKISFKEQMDVIKAKFQTFKPIRIGIESNAYQRALPQELRRSNLLPLHEIKTTRDKHIRMIALSYYFENRKIYIKEDMADFINEYISYEKGGKSPDQLDALDFAIETAIGKVQRSIITGAHGGSEKKPWEDQISRPSDGKRRPFVI